METTYKIASSMLKENMPTELICRITDLSKDELKRLPFLYSKKEQV